MGSYNITLKPSISKDLRSLPKPVIPRVIGQIEELQNDPIPRQSVKLSGAENLYRIRIGNYRIVYGIDRKLKEITVHYVRHRREAYR